MGKDTLEISENKLIRVSWGAFAAFVFFLITIVLWLSNVDNKASAANKEISEIKPTLNTVNDRTIRIETILNELKNQRGHR